MDKPITFLSFTLHVLFAFLVTNISSQKSTVPDIPTEVLRRYGGLTMEQKRALYTQYQSLQFVAIPAFLKPQISNIDALERFGVCKTPGQSEQTQPSFFVCPNSPVTGSVAVEDEKRFCCGPVAEQYCCSAAEFIAGIRIVSPAQIVSPSVIIGCSLAFLLIAAFLAIVAYSRIARSLRKQSSRMHYQSTSNSGYAPPREYGSKNSFLSSHIPPSKQLISNRSTVNNTEKHVEAKQIHPPEPLHEDREVMKTKQPPALRLLSGAPVSHPSKQTVSARPSKRQAYKRQSKS